MSKRPNPQYYLLWRHEGENHWDACTRDEALALCDSLIQRGVNPASVILIPGTGMIYWMFPQYHKGKKRCWMSDLYAEICGTEKLPDYTGPDVQPPPPSDPDHYGFISPDGRYFQCGYGGHMELARKIVGFLKEIRDPHRYLEDQGWLTIYHDPAEAMEKYAVGMGDGHHMTDPQLLKLQSLGFPDRTKGILEHLM